MKLADLLRDVPVRELRGDANVDITSVTPDSRLVTKGALFVAIPGTAKDGTQFIPQAIEKGAAGSSRRLHRQPGVRNQQSASQPSSSMTRAARSHSSPRTSTAVPRTTSRSSASPAHRGRPRRRA
jgi:UDP-N-acetylmuramyl pentapeptide synthase